MQQMQVQKQNATVCPPALCAGCAACADRCAVGAIRVEHGLQNCRAVIDAARCTHCGRCTALCPAMHAATLAAPIAWQQGWAADAQVRAASASGGAAAAIAAAFAAGGGIVCACAYREGKFGFSFAETPADTAVFKGSKYVKSNPQGVYRQIAAYLQAGKKVLFIGLPCQVAAVRNYTKDAAGLYTVDLICHGSPSVTLLRMYLAERGYAENKVSSVDFRQKDSFFLSANGKGVEPPTVYDRYTFAFLEALDYTENCYACRYATEKRVSDLTLGDAWGSELSREEQKKGISLLLCNSERGRELLKTADMCLFPIDAETAKRANRQLTAPSAAPDAREKFFRILARTQNFSRAVSRCYPTVFLRQDLKRVLIRMHLIRPKTDTAHCKEKDKA